MVNSLHEKAEENLRYIRAAMESATEFTGVSGKGYIVAGLSAVLAAWTAAQQLDGRVWFGVWMLELVFAGVAALALTAHKVRTQGKALFSGSGRKLFLAFIPTMLAGALLTLACFLLGLWYLLPGMCLVLYGAAVITAGAHSVTVIPMMGSGFIVLGAFALLTPISGDLLLGLGFGGLHLVTGFFIWREYGG